MGPPVNRTPGKKMEESSSNPALVTPASSQDAVDNEILPLDNMALDDDLDQEQQDNTPRRNPPRRNQQQPQRQPERPHKEDVLTQLAKEILTMRWEVATNQRQQARQDEVPEDPNFNWLLLKLTAETTFDPRHRYRPANCG